MTIHAGEICVNELECVGRGPGFGIDVEFGLECVKGSVRKTRGSSGHSEELVSIYRVVVQNLSRWKDCLIVMKPEES